MRRLAGLLGGALLALMLFYLLALLVAPPEPDETQVIEPTSMAMVDAVPQEQPVPAQSAAAAPTPPSQPPPPPAAAPEPAAQSPSPIEIPEPRTPPVETPDVSLDEDLPALDEIEPAPQPQPDPQPAPEPEPEPEPAPQPEATAPASTQTADAEIPSESASPSAPAQSPRGTQASPRDVGELNPTRRVNPEYPRRAQRRGLEGYVEVRFTIQPDGRVDTSTLQVIDANPPRVFDREVEQAMAQWRFPQADDFRQVTQRIEFKLGRR